MKNITYLISIVSLLGCADDSIELPACRLEAYGKISRLGKDSLEFVGYSHELNYEGNRLIARINNPTQFSTQYKPTTIDSLIYEGRRLFEIRKVYPNGELIRQYKFKYEHNLVSSIDHYVKVYNQENEGRMDLIKQEQIKHDQKGRLSEVKVIDPDNNPKQILTSTKYVYKDDNLYQVIETNIFLDHGDTTGIRQVFETYSNYDSLNNPFRGLALIDLREVAYSLNNHRSYKRVRYFNGIADHPSTYNVKYGYNERGYPDSGRYACD